MTLVASAPGRRARPRQNGSQLGSGPSKSSQGIYGSKITRRIVTLLGTIVAIYILMPLYWIFIAATKTDSTLLNSFGFLPAGRFELINNIKSLFLYHGGVYGRWLIDTAVYTGIAAIGATFVCSLAGYAFARYQFKGRGAMFGLIIGSVMVPTTVLVIPLYLMYDHVGLLDTAAGFILPSLVNPLGVYLMRLYSDAAVPRELVDSARIDGAGEFRIFRSIAARLISPGAVTVLLFSVVGTWNNYFLPLLIFSSESKMPLTVGLGLLSSRASTANAGAEQLYTMIVTGGLVAVIPLMIVFLLLQRYWRGGLTFGSLAG